MNWVRKIIRATHEWVFSEELLELKKLQIKLEVAINDATRAKQIAENLEQRSNHLLENISVGVDVHDGADRFSKNWAVISIQGKQDYLKFIDMRDADMRTIASFLRSFERQNNITIDASPNTTQFLKMELRR